MSPDPERRRQTIGVALIGGTQTIQYIGWAFAAILNSPLIVAVPMTAVGTSALLLWVMSRSGKTAGALSRPMWKLVVRLAITNAVISITIPMAQQEMGLGTVAAITVLGPLSAGLSTVWREWRTAWGLAHLGLRGLAVAGVVILNRPWTGEFNLFGLGLAFVSAACFWNYVAVMAEMRVVSNQKLAYKGVAVANFMAAPLVTIAVLAIKGASWVPEWTASPEKLGIAAVAGLLVWGFPTIMQNAAFNRASSRVLGVPYALTTVIAAVIGVIGAGLGAIDATNRPTPWGWVGIAIVTIASISVSQLSDRPTPRQRQS